MKEWKLRGSKLLLAGLPGEVQIGRYSILGGLVSHCSLDNSRSLLCFIAGQFTLRFTGCWSQRGLFINLTVMLIVFSCVISLSVGNIDMLHQSLCCSCHSDFIWKEDYPHFGYSIHRVKIFSLKTRKVSVFPGERRDLNKLTVLELSLNQWRNKNLKHQLMEDTVLFLWVKSFDLNTASNVCQWPFFWVYKNIFFDCLLVYLIIMASAPSWYNFSLNHLSISYFPKTLLFLLDR